MDSDTLGKTVRRTEDKSVYKHVYRGNLVFNMMRAWQGAIGIVKTEGMVSPAYITAKSKNIVFPPFMNYAMRRSSMIAQMNSLSYGLMAFRKRLYWKPFTTAYCYIPSVREQSAIADLLEHLDWTIALHQRKLNLYKGLKKGYLQQLFPSHGEKQPQLRFANFTGDWEQRKLGEVASFLNGRAYKQDELLDKGKYKVLRVGNFYTNGEWYYSNMELGEKFYAQKGDLLYTWSATFGPHIWNGDKVIYHYHIWKVELSNELDKEFADQLLQNDKNKITSDKNGSTMVHITKKRMEEETILLPSIDEQKKIGAFFQNIDHLITLHQQKIEKLIKLKQVYLQKLFV